MTLNVAYNSTVVTTNTTVIPPVGQLINMRDGSVLMYNGKSFVEVAFESRIAGPLPSELNRHPSLKGAWEEYCAIRKLLGVGARLPPPPQMSTNKNRNFAPTDAELEKHPSLKSAWEHYLVIRKIVDPKRVRGKSDGTI